MVCSVLCHSMTYTRMKVEMCVGVGKLFSRSITFSKLHFQHCLFLCCKQSKKLFLYQYYLKMYIQIDNSKSWRGQRAFEWFWPCEAWNCLTAFSTSRFLTRSSGCLVCSDLHSGQLQVSWQAIKLEIQAWQKLCPQFSVIRIGEVKMPFQCWNSIYKLPKKVSFS